jgi:hypothetical protein
MFAKDAYFLYGSKAVHWQVFTVVVLCVLDAVDLDFEEKYAKNPNQYGLGYDEEDREIERMKSVIRFVLNYKVEFHKRGDLLQLLSHSRLCGASDKRDRIYAFLGLVSPMSNIVPDYGTKSVQDVFMETARGIIQHDNSLNILSHAAICRGEFSRLLPSWVPDWTSHEIATWFVPGNISKARDIWSMLPHVNHDLHVSNDGRVLETSGIFVEKLVLRFRKEAMGPLVGNLFAVFALDSSHVIRTHQAAQLLDEVWLLPDLRSPVVLRRGSRCVNSSDDRGCDLRLHGACGTRREQNLQRISLH